MNKEWKNIPGYEKLYKVSNYGEVKVKRRVIYQMIDGEVQPMRVAKEHLLVPFDNGNGYLVASLLDDDGKRKNFYIHRLVADAFIPNPNSYPQVDHIDYNRKNNRVTNLRWVSVTENLRHSSCNRPKSRMCCFSSTGYKYIYKRKDFYRLDMPFGSKRIDKQFSTLDEAIEIRNKIAKEYGIAIKDNIN